MRRWIFDTCKQTTKKTDQWYTKAKWPTRRRLKIHSQKPSTSTQTFHLHEELVPSHLTKIPFDHVTFRQSKFCCQLSVYSFAHTKTKLCTCSCHAICRVLCKVAAMLKLGLIYRAANWNIDRLNVYLLLSVSSRPCHHLLSDYHRSSKD